MAAQLNVLDYAILVILAVGVLHGLTRGALRMVTPIISFVCGIYAASIWYGQVGAIVERNFEVTGVFAQDQAGKVGNAQASGPVNFA